MRLATIVFSIGLLVSPAFGGTESYVCSVSSLKTLRDDGALTADNPKDPITGQEFTVDRITGKIIGKYLESTGYQTRVLDSGSDQQSFKMIGTSSPGYLHVLYLQIDEFRKARLKPFVLVDNSLVYSGTCQ
jgi:hypothetical protein